MITIKKKEKKRKMEREDRKQQVKYDPWVMEMKGEKRVSRWNVTWKTSSSFSFVPHFFLILQSLKKFSLKNLLFGVFSLKLNRIHCEFKT